MFPESEDYDIYLSSPMGSLRSDEKYQEMRSQALAILQAFENECRLKVYYYGRDIQSRDYLDESDLPVAKISQCVEAMRRSKYFVLYYPARLSSSVLVEAGFALALQKQAVYFVKSRDHLPFLLRYSESAFPVRIHQYKSLEGLLGVIRTHGERLFNLALPDSLRTPPAGPDPTIGKKLPATDLQTAMKQKLRDLRQTVAELSEEIQSLESLLHVDVSSSLNKIRFITEKVLHKLCTQRNVSWGQAEPTLERMIGPLISAGVIPKNVSVHVRTIQTNASPGSHFQESALSHTHLVIAQQALIELLEWFANIPARAEPSGAPDSGIVGLGRQEERG